MKKFFYLFVSAAMLMLMPSCGTPNENQPENPDDETPEYLDKKVESSMVVYLGQVPLPLDTTIVVTEVEENSFTGMKEMGISGLIKGVKGFRVTATRSEAGQVDELCAGVECKPGDGELVQDFDYTLLGGATEASWYTHYKPTKAGDYTITYTFQNYNRTVSLKVIYRNNE